MHRSIARTLLALLAAALLALSAGCGGGAGTGSGSGTRDIATERGTVAVPADPQRVVVLNGALAGYLYDLDVPVTAADPRLLGVNNRTGEFPEAWAADARAQGTTALPIGQSINLELIVAQQPDLIIGGGQGFTAQQSIDAYDQLSAIAPTVLVPASASGWQEQLRLLADVAGRGDRVDGLVAAYRDKVGEVRARIRPPQGAAAYLQSRRDNTPTVVLPGAALPSLLAEVGIRADDAVAAKAGNPARSGAAADWLEFSPELLTRVVDAPVVFVVPLNDGRDATALGADPVYAQLPAFRGGTVFDLPATSLRPDYRGVMRTLDLIAERFS
ncbi:ABC transporter substrate-binding protein [Nocardia jiangsuensis]|uniref:ABC transporter substrate-binding protein n=1 Tax=Nocardia jiangsuensis TaxID=1691563 RepID=A0ABV8E2D6_9NOCA